MPVSGVSFPTIPTADTPAVNNNAAPASQGGLLGSNDLLSIMTKAALADVLLSDDEDEKKKSSSMVRMALDMYLTASALQAINASYNNLAGAIEPAAASGSANSNMTLLSGGGMMAGGGIAA